MDWKTIFRWTWQILIMLAAIVGVAFVVEFVDQTR